MLQLLVKGRWTCLLWDFVWVGCRGHIIRLYTKKKKEKTWVSQCLSLWVTSVQWAKLSSTKLLGPIFFLKVTHPASWENLPRLKPHPSQPTVNPNGSIGRSRRLIAHRLAVGFTFANGFQEMILETTQPNKSKEKLGIVGCSKTIRKHLNF